MRWSLLFLLLNECIDFNTPVFTSGVDPRTAAHVVTTFPNDGAVNVEANASLTVLFSKAMQTESVRISCRGATFENFFWDQNDTRVTAFVSDTLAFSTVYDVLIAGTDVDGSELVPLTIRFTVVSAPSEMGARAPTVSSTTPMNGAQNVALRPIVSVMFSKAMSDATITLNPSVSLGAFAWSDGNTVLSYSAPDTDLLPTQSYTMTIEGTSVDGEALVATSTTFSTVTPQDLTAPQIESRFPVDQMTGVGLTSDVNISFSEPMQVGTVTIALSNIVGPTALPCALSADAARKSFTCNPSSPFAAMATITVDVGPGALDDHGNAVAGVLHHQFTSGAQADMTPPALIGVTPATGAVGVLPAASQMIFNFSEAVTHAGFSVRDASTQDVTSTGNMTWNPASTQLVWTPIAAPAPGTEYYWSFTSAMEDGSHNPLSPASGFFRVMRREKRTIYALSGASNEGHLGTNYLHSDAGAQAAYGGVVFGDWDTPEAEMRGYITFNLTDMISGLGITPAQVPSTYIRSAVFKVYLAACKHDGAAFTGALSGIGLGTAFAESVFFSALNTADFYRPVDTAASCWFLGGAGCRTSLFYDYFTPYDCVAGYKTIGARELVNGSEVTELDAVDKVRFDWTNNGPRSFKSQWRFRFFVGQDNDSPPKQDHLTWYGGVNGQSVRPKLDVEFDYP